MKRNSIKQWKFPIAGSLLILGLVGCSTLKDPANTTVLLPQQIESIVASPDRSAADRTNDLRRKPQAMLAFIGIRPGMKALDISAAGGYTSELLARAVGPATAPEGNSHPSTPAAIAPAPASPRRSSPDALAEREKSLQANASRAAHIIAVVQRFDDPAPADMKTASFDLATLMFNYHDLGYQEVDRDKMNRAVYAALKPGGMYVIADHAGRADTGISESGTLHRIEEAFLVKEVESAGFKLISRGDFLRNPNDPRDKNTPNPPQPKDEFVLKFVRP